MHDINRLASIVVWRGFGFAWLAIGTAMAGLVFDLTLATLIGAGLGMVLAVILQIRAETYHRVRRITECEVWILLADDQRPALDTARQLIVPAMRTELREKALYSAVMGAALLAISLILRIAMGMAV